MIKNKAQATLEFALVLIIGMALIAGFYRIAAWLRGHIPARQDQYEFDRLGAGKIKSAGQPEVGYYNASLIAEDQVYLLKK